MARQDEDIELVLGNKQILSLFFVVVLFFAAFFSVGYTVGFGHGEQNGPAPSLANAEREQESLEKGSFPDSLLKEAPELPAAPSRQMSKGALERAVPDLADVAPPVVNPPDHKKPAKVEEKPKPTMAKASPPPATPVIEKKPSPAQPQAPAPKAAAPAEGAYHLQVAALRVTKDAEMLAGTLKDKGYPATVRTGDGDGWNRVLVGPFQSAEAAKDFRTRLKTDGFDTMLRKQ